MPKGNPRPIQTEKFKEGWFKPQGEIPPGEKLASKMLAVRVTESIDAAVRALPEKSAWLRRVISEAAKRELLGQATVSEKATPSPPPASPPIDADTLAKVLTEVLSVPRLPAVAKKRLEALLETLSQSQGH